jgi:hypothetical protein
MRWQPGTEHHPNDMDLLSDDGWLQGWVGRINGDFQGNLVGWAAQAEFAALEEAQRWVEVQVVIKKLERS